MGLEDDTKFEPVELRNEQAVLELQEAVSLINNELDGVFSTGAFDTEPSQLRGLLKELGDKNRRRSVQAIRADALAIIARRNLDH
jgi:hypothetical protein